MLHFFAYTDQPIINAAELFEDGPHFIYLPFVESKELSPGVSDVPKQSITATLSFAVTKRATATRQKVTAPSVATQTHVPLATVTPTLLSTSVDFLEPPTAIPAATPLIITPVIATPALTDVAVQTVTATSTDIVTSTSTAITPILTASAVPAATTPAAFTQTLVPTVSTVTPTVTAAITPATAVVTAITPVATGSPTATTSPTVLPTSSEVVFTPTLLTPTLLLPTGSATVGTILLPATSTPTSTPIQVMTPEPTSTAIVVNAACSTNDLSTLSTGKIVAKVQADPDCAEPLVALLIDDPDPYFAAFYELVPSIEATEVLWWAVYGSMSKGDFQFSAEHVENLWTNLPVAAAACMDHARCPFWYSYMVEPLLRGELYRCPNVESLDPAALLESVPYGNYYCTADTANALVPLIDKAGISTLLTIATEQREGWSRRNALRILGRIAERGAADPASALVLDTLAEDVKSMLLSRLVIERSIYALEDLVWVADSHFYPLVDAQSALADIVQDVTLADTVTFRAMAAITRLLVAKDQLSQPDLDFVLEQLNSTALYIRSQAARTLVVLNAAHVSDFGTIKGNAERSQITAALADRLEVEDDFMVQIALQEALDLYADTDIVSQMQAKYEAENLAAILEDAPITIRSGLPQEELSPFLARMQSTERAFFSTLGDSFRTPVEGDPTEAMTLLLFETRAAYQQYMDAFVGFGAQAGGLYIERDATLYTYQRTAEESSFTVEHLVQHEFTHYLNGRYVFPGLWTDPEFHEQPKGWIDEGAAEYFGLTIFHKDGGYSQPLADARLATLCNGPAHTALEVLLNRRAGYDEVGIFDYDYAWAFMYYLQQQRPPIALKIFDAYRDESYAIEEFNSVAGVSVESLESAWHSAMDSWCDSRNLVQTAGYSEEVEHNTHESEVINHRGTIYTLPMPPAQSTDGLDDDDKVIRLITNE